jgi:uncharacterized protein
MSVEENKKVVSEFIDAVYAGDTDRLTAVLAEDAVWEFPGPLPVQDTYHGRDAILNDMLGTRAMPLYEPGSLSCEVTSLIGEGDTVAAEWRGRARSAKGKPYDNLYSFFFTVSDGAITSLREYCDTYYVKEVLYADA